MCKVTQRWTLAGGGLGGGNFWRFFAAVVNESSNQRWFED